MQHRRKAIATQLVKQYITGSAPVTWHDVELAIKAMKEVKHDSIR
jgi:primase-polymerase (primpol)-like protein